MKAFLLSSLLFASSVWATGDLVMPTPGQMETWVCVGGSLTETYSVTSTDPSTGFVSGIVFMQDKCTSRSGKVTVTGYHSVCADVVWDGNGLIQSVDVTNTSAGRISQSIASCKA